MSHIPRECERCDTPSAKLTPVVNSISHTYLCPTCLARHVATFGRDPQLDPFARMRAGQRLA